ncbi:MAG: hypothetical protein WD749_14390 [Phycisphaerales bacterium]
MNRPARVLTTISIILSLTGPSKALVPAGPAPEHGTPSATLRHAAGTAQTQPVAR